MIITSFSVGLAIKKFELHCYDRIKDGEKNDYVVDRYDDNATVYFYDGSAAKGRQGEQTRAA